MQACLVKPIINKKYINKYSNFTDSDISEFKKLSEALPGVEIKYVSSLNLKKIYSGTLIGKGKIEFLKNIIFKEKISLLIVDFELTPIQQRNLERELNLKILDRTALIIEIFSCRALSKEGVLQVELAHLNYNKSRLVRSWTHLERQRGGMGFLGGPGETQIEADKRAINTRILQIKSELNKVVKTRTIHRSSRDKIPFYTIAIVGYTNSGKSTIFNKLTNSNVLSKDMLFATLDPKMKRLDLNLSNDIILSDTVGFISNLPIQLVKSFKATLEEVIYADCILHVRDFSSENFHYQSTVVYNILEELGVSKNNKTILEVWNKTDLINLSISSKKNYENMKKMVLVSAKTGEGIEQLKDNISKIFNEKKYKETIFVPFKRTKIRSWLFDKKLIFDEKISDNGFSISVFWNDNYRNKYFKKIGKL